MENFQNLQKLHHFALAAYAAMRHRGVNNIPPYLLFCVLNSRLNTLNLKAFGFGSLFLFCRSFNVYPSEDQGAHLDCIDRMSQVAKLDAWKFYKAIPTS